MVLYLLGLASLRSFCFAFSSDEAMVMFDQPWASLAQILLGQVPGQVFGLAEFGLQCLCNNWSVPWGCQVCDSEVAEWLLMTLLSL